MKPRSPKRQSPGKNGSAPLSGGTRFHLTPAGLDTLMAAEVFDADPELMVRIEQMAQSGQTPAEIADILIDEGADPDQRAQLEAAARDAALDPEPALVDGMAISEEDLAPIISTVRRALQDWE